MSDRLNMPLEHDFKFYQRRKHDKWLEVPAPAPALEGPVADSHAHVHMLPDPAWELARCAANGVDLVCMIADPSEDGSPTLAREEQQRLPAETVVGPAYVLRRLESVSVPAPAFVRPPVPETTPEISSVPDATENVVSP